jgi:hypothetical protein
LLLIGAYLYARRIGCNRRGSMIAGITFVFGGYMTVHLGHTNLIAAGALLPRVLLALEELYLNLRWSWDAVYRAAVFRRRALGDLLRANGRQGVQASSH